MSGCKVHFTHRSGAFDAPLPCRVASGLTVDTWTPRGKKRADQPAPTTRVRHYS